MTKGIFPNLNKNIAEYDVRTFFITLHETSIAQFEYFKTNKTDIESGRKFSVLIHELRHSLDHIATLWGQRNIIKLFNAVNARLSNDEKEFYKILPFKIEERQFHYLEYYTQISSFAPWRGFDDNWIWRLTSGIKFDLTGKPDENLPIPFIRFYKQSGEPIVRVPISIASLLETNAVNDEYNFFYSFLNNLDEDTATVERTITNKSLFKDILYNQKNAVYNCAVHLVANVLNISEVTIALEISSALSTLTLNIPFEYWKNIPIPQIAKDTWQHRTLNMIANYEYGFLFYCILNNYAPFYLYDQEYSIERVLLSNSLPPLEEIAKLVHSEFQKNKEHVSLFPNFSNQFSNILDHGVEVFGLRGIDGKNSNTLEIMVKQKVKPNIIFNDTDFELEEYKMDQNLKLPIDNLNERQWYSFVQEIDKLFEEFFNIRGL
jgi:hypothetical protein